MLWIKAFHIVFVTCWFAGLFYLPRIFVNLALLAPGAAAERERLLLMARKLLRFTTLLSAPALALGVWLWLGYGIGRGPGSGWMHAQLAVVPLVIGYHHGWRRRCCWWCSSRFAASAHAPELRGAAGAELRGADRLCQPVPVRGLARAGHRPAGVSAGGAAPAILDLVRCADQCRRLCAAGFFAGAGPAAHRLGPQGGAAGHAGGGAAVAGNGVLADLSAPAGAVQPGSGAQCRWRAGGGLDRGLPGTPRRARALARLARALAPARCPRRHGAAGAVAAGIAFSGRRAFRAGPGAAAAGDGADRLAGPYPIDPVDAVDAVDPAARWPAIAPDRAGAAVPRWRTAMRRAGAARPLPVGLLRDPPGAAPRAAGAGAGGTGHRAHGAVGRAELGPGPCLAVAEPARPPRAFGCAGAGLAAARPAAPGLRGHAAAGAGLAVGAAQPGAHQRLLCPDLAALGAGPLHPLLWPGPVARLALALCHIAVCAAAGIGPAAA